MLFGFLARRIEHGMAFCLMYMRWFEYLFSQILVKRCIPGAGHGSLMLLLFLVYVGLVVADTIMHDNRRMKRLREREE